MLTLVTVIYGSAQSYRQELYGSILSILKARMRQDTRIVVYTDRELAGFPLPCVQRLITAAEWDEWTGQSGLTHLMKLHIIRLTLQEAGHPVIYFDTDTVFLTPPEELAALLSPGTALMHAAEGPISGHEIWSNIAEWLGDGRVLAGVRVSSDSIMYNSGIVGVVPEHLDALERTSRLADKLETVDPVFSIDQFATGSALSASAEVLTCEEQVLHYWGWRREFIQHAIGKFWARHQRAEPEQACADFDPMELSMLPRIHWLDRIRARAVAEIRGIQPDARFAYLALLSALRHASRGELEVANLWFAVHVKFLSFSGGAPTGVGNTPRWLLRSHDRCHGWLDEKNLASLGRFRTAAEADD